MVGMRVRFKSLVNAFIIKRFKSTHSMIMIVIMSANIVGHEWNMKFQNLLKASFDSPYI